MSGRPWPPPLNPLGDPMGKVKWALLYPFGWILSWLIPVAEEILDRKKAVPATLRSAGPSAEYGEEPPSGLDIQRTYNRALSDRVDAAVAQDVDLQARRKVWAERQEWERKVAEEIDEMILDEEQGF